MAMGILRPVAWFFFGVAMRASSFIMHGAGMSREGRVGDASDPANGGFSFCYLSI